MAERKSEHALSQKTTSQQTNEVNPKQFSN